MPEEPAPSMRKSLEGVGWDARSFRADLVAKRVPRTLVLTI